MSSRRRRVEVRVEGTVQGVGFRPFVHRLAGELELGGWVLNDSQGVLLEVEGEASSVAAFLTRLEGEAPPLATLAAVRVEERDPEGATRFSIVTSRGGGAPSAQVSPDAATCADCLRELLDPEDRRFRYPFTNCTNCGPRFTIVRDIPYDRPNTSMAGFPMCPECRAEYEDPTDRRFHAQPNACPTCGPRVRLVDARDRAVREPWAGVDPVEAAARALRQGAVVAVKGLGGYHLACRADDEGAVARLRARKHREDKPFAVMVADVEAAREVVALGPGEESLLTSPARPIVLARRRGSRTVAPSVAPGHRDLGVFLPYTPLHHLLLRDAGCGLVMTSGNVSDEPLAYEDDEARTRLAEIADLFLVHDRPIETRTDDSVVRTVPRRTGTAPVVLRRSRGFVPAPRILPWRLPRPALACGGHLKNTFALGRGNQVWMGPHIGDLENLETLTSFREGIAHMEALFQVEPRLLVHDLHPGYLSTAYALERAEEAGGGLATLAIQHHHAHLAGCLAEHGWTGPVAGAVFDGTGYGEDGTVWGGEILVGDAASSRRAAHLRPVRLPGGDQAVREPWRLACAWLVALEGEGVEAPAELREAVDEPAWEAVKRMSATGFRSPWTTSMGRLFDAVSALCGLRLRTTYEGQAAIELEMAVDPDERGSYPLPLVERGEGPLELDAAAIVEAVVADRAAGRSAGVVAARFHRGVARATAAVLAREAEAVGTDTVALSGGVFQNAVLLAGTVEALEERALRVLVPSAIPPNDGGLAWGQMAAAAARLHRDG